MAIALRILSSIREDIEKILSAYDWRNSVSLKADLVEQFKGQPNIEAVMEVIAEQLQDVADFYEDLRTQRSISTAVGSQLDGVGDIVVLAQQVLRMVFRAEDASVQEHDRRVLRVLVVVQGLLPEHTEGPDEVWVGAGY